ncbi:stage III sporulation protein AF [Paenibacillus pectinilyticus]|uniref:Stage III sporulation protein AF n=1 Tax=Paenibacillus pectinilyticus TaxID=512399 RepID=A0A1C0ZWD1_9BACL|nr:stage III sporulation protein AF [Paenibacillus pectinilyticus]OCT12424.1 stage III sporulation protein AF [Paenibacillus pectinilyticus]
MDWLAGWLKTVIMVIMLATFVDLLLPSNTMQRYVKTVLSLFILLTLLTPVLQLFQKNWNMDQLLTQAEKSQNEKSMLASSIGSSSQMKSLDAIKRDAQKIQDADTKKTQQLVQTQLAGLIKEDMQKQTEWPIKEVFVQVQLDNNGKPTITHVKVSLDDIEAKQQPAPSTKSIAVMEPVKPVEPIKIGAASNGQAHEVIAQGGAQTPSESMPTGQELDRIKQTIVRNWLVDPAQIEIGVNGRKG